MWGTITVNMTLREGHDDDLIKRRFRSAVRSLAAKIERDLGRQVLDDSDLNGVIASYRNLNSGESDE